MCMPRIFQICLTQSALEDCIYFAVFYCEISVSFVYILIGCVRVRARVTSGLRASSGSMECSKVSFIESRVFLVGPVG